MKNEVANFINENFEVEKFNISDCKLFPAGKILTDQEGNAILIYFDINTDKVTFKFIEEN